MRYQKREAQHCINDYNKKCFNYFEFNEDI